MDAGNRVLSSAPPASGDNATAATVVEDTAADAVDVASVDVGVSDVMEDECGPEAVVPVDAQSGCDRPADIVDQVIDFVESTSGKNRRRRRRGKNNGSAQNGEAEEPEADCCCTSPDDDSVESSSARQPLGKQSIKQKETQGPHQTSSTIAPIKRPPQQHSRRRKLTRAATTACADEDASSLRRDDAGSVRERDLDSARRRTDWKSSATGSGGVVNLSFDDSSSCPQRTLPATGGTETSSMNCVRPLDAVTTDESRLNEAGDSGTRQSTDRNDNTEACVSSIASPASADIDPKSRPDMVTVMTELTPAGKSNTADGAGAGAGNGGFSAAPEMSGQSLLVRQAFRIAAAVGGTYSAPGGVAVIRMTDVSPVGGGVIGADTQPLLVVDDGDGGAGTGGAASEGESSLRIIGEILMPFLLAGFGCVFAGLVLGIVQVLGIMCVCVCVCVVAIIMRIMVFKSNG